MIAVSADHVYTDSNMSHLLRFLSVYDWLNPFQFSSHPDFVVKLVEHAAIAPPRLTVSIPGRRTPRRRTLSAKNPLIRVLSEFSEYEWLALDDPIDRDFSNVRSQVAITETDYTITVFRSKFPTDLVIKHLQLVSTHITPAYGFSHSVFGPAALSFPHGIGASTMDNDTWRRVNDLGHSLRVTKEHLKGKLHDVYGVNVLSPLHLERQVEGQSLGDWIGAGSRGELLTIKDEVFAWIVSDSVRPAVRDTLFREGALIASV
jgi:hypothetical protein